MGDDPWGDDEVGSSGLPPEDHPVEELGDEVLDDEGCSSHAKEKSIEGDRKSLPLDQLGAELETPETDRWVRSLKPLQTNDLLPGELPDGVGGLPMEDRMLFAAEARELRRRELEKPGPRAVAFRNRNVMLDDELQVGNSPAELRQKVSKLEVGMRSGMSTLQRTMDEREKDQVELALLARKVNRLTQQNAKLEQEAADHIAALEKMRKLVEDKKENSILLKAYYNTQSEKMKEECDQKVREAEERADTTIASMKEELERNEENHRQELFSKEQQCDDSNSAKAQALAERDADLRAAVEAAETRMRLEMQKQVAEHAEVLEGERKEKEEATAMLGEAERVNADLTVRLSNMKDQLTVAKDTLLMHQSHNQSSGERIRILEHTIQTMQGSIEQSTANNERDSGVMPKLRALEDENGALKAMIYDHDGMAQRLREILVGSLRLHVNEVQEIPVPELMMMLKARTAQQAQATETYREFATDIMAHVDGDIADHPRGASANEDLRHRLHAVSDAVGRQMGSPRWGDEWGGQVQSPPRTRSTSPAPRGSNGVDAQAKRGPMLKSIFAAHGYLDRCLSALGREGMGRDYAAPTRSSILRKEANTTRYSGERRRSGSASGRMGSGGAAPLPDPDGLTASQRREVAGLASQAQERLHWAVGNCFTLAEKRSAGVDPSRFAPLR